MLCSKPKGRRLGREFLFLGYEVAKQQKVNYCIEVLELVCLYQTHIYYDCLKTNLLIINAFDSRI